VRVGFHFNSATNAPKEAADILGIRGLLVEVGSQLLSEKMSRA